MHWEQSCLGLFVSRASLPAPDGDCCAVVFVPAPFAGCTAGVQQRGNTAAFSTTLAETATTTETDAVSSDISATKTIRSKKITARLSALPCFYEKPLTAF